MFALELGSRFGGFLVAAALIGHAGWDVIHHRRNHVVPRSLAEGCIFLDVPLGLAALLLAFLGPPSSTGSTRVRSTRMPPR